jgi:hypothetical protein
MNPSPTDRVTVLYVMGLWRSGSTILDIILGNHHDIASAGELRSLPIILQEGGTCACGESASSCRHWSDVRELWTERVGPDNVARLADLQDRFERVRSVPALLAGGVVRSSSAFRAYGELLGQLYSAIGQVSQKSIVVDSTKYPGRALALSQVLGDRLRLIHLVRDGRGVIWSWYRKANVDIHGNVLQVDRDKVVGETTRKWLAVNLFSSFVAKRAGDRAIRLRYEDLVAQPRQELTRIGRLVGTDFGPVADRLIEGSAIQAGHMIAGNRVRLQGAIRLRPDLEWQEKLSAADRRSFWKRAGWLARRYGYVE